MRNSKKIKSLRIVAVIFPFLISVLLSLFFDKDASASMCQPWNEANNPPSFECGLQWGGPFPIECFYIDPFGGLQMTECEYIKKRFTCTGVKWGSDTSVYTPTDCTWPDPPPPIGKGPRKPPSSRPGVLVTYDWDEIDGIVGDEYCTAQWCGINCLPGETPTVSFHEAACGENEPDPGGS